MDEPAPPRGRDGPEPGTRPPEPIAALLEAAAADFMAGSGNQNPADGERLFDDPFFGVASGADPLWEVFLGHFGPAFWTPAEAFRRGTGGQETDRTDRADRADPPDPDASELSVVAFVCPQTRATIADQRRAKDFPSRRWTASRFLHDQAVGGLNERLAEVLRAEGLQAVVPDHLPGFAMIPHERLQIISPWSHRHAAFAAGLGTFGLCDGLITKAGKAHRMGSLIVRARLASTPRTYQGPYDWCLYHSSGRCAKCVDRCPAGALTKAGHDKARCRSFLSQTTAARIPGLWPELSGAYACGLCQSAVPCDTRRPGPA